MMDTEYLLRKLEPLCSADVKHWRHVRATGSARLRGIVDRQIAVTAENLFGRANNSVLLSRPSKKSISGEFSLGNLVYEDELWPVGLSRSELLQNLAVFGRSGAGKTNLVFHLLEQLHEKRIPFLFLDWKRTGRHLCRG